MNPSVSSSLTRVACVALSLGLTAALAVGVSTPASAKKKPKLANLTSKMLNVDEVRRAAGTPAALTLQSQHAMTGKGIYNRAYSEQGGVAARYIVGIAQVTKSPGGGSDGSGGDTPPNDMTCEFLEKSKSKSTVVCFNDTMVMATSSWKITSKKVSWSVYGQSLRLLIDFTDGSITELTDQIKKAEVASAKAIRDAQKKKAFG